MSLRSVVVLCLVLVTTGCASTQMTKNWVYPEHGPLDFDKVMALVLVQDPLVRQSGEEALVRRIQRAEAVASYEVLPYEKMEDVEEVERAVEASGVDAVVVMRPISDQEEVRYVPGSYPAPYYSFYGYYGWAYPISYSPGYFKKERTVAIETHVYDASDGKLVWSGVSQTSNPKDVRKLVDDTAKAVRKAMRQYGFLS